MEVPGSFDLDELRAGSGRRERGILKRGDLRAEGRVGTGHFDPPVTIRWRAADHDVAPCFDEHRSAVSNRAQRLIEDEALCNRAQVELHARPSETGRRLRRIEVEIV